MNAELIFSPNVVYLALVLGFMFTFFAVIVPGSGFNELGALVGMVFAGVGVYMLLDKVNFWAVLVLLLGVLPFLLAVRVSGKPIYLVISLIALTIGSAYLFRGDTWWKPGVNLALVIVVSILNAAFLWLVVRKGLEANLARPVQDMTRLIGLTGTAETSVHLDGTVQVASELWSARSTNPIPKGEHVKVIARDGFILEVEPVNPATSSPQIEV